MCPVCSAQGLGSRVQDLGSRLWGVGCGGVGSQTATEELGGHPERSAAGARRGVALGLSLIHI
eukprot:903576-Rhodomonas_salina.1